MSVYINFGPGNQVWFILLAHHMGVEEVDMAIALFKMGRYARDGKQIAIASRKEGGYVIETDGTKFEFGPDGTLINDETPVGVVHPMDVPEVAAAAYKPFPAPEKGKRKRGRL